MSYPSDFVTIQNAVIEKARLDATNDVPKVKDWINQAYARIAVEVEFFQVSNVTAPPLTPGQQSVAVPTAMVGVSYVVPFGSDGSAWGPMEEIGSQEMYELRAWQGGTVPLGAPTRYAFSSAGAPTIDFYPAAGGGETFTFYGYRLPDPLVADGAFPIFPEPYASKCIEYGALIDACEFKKDIFMLSGYQQDFGTWLAQFRAFTTSRRGDRVIAMPVDKQRPYPRGNSVDTGVY